MTTSASLFLRATSIALAAGLGLAACSTDAYENQPGGTADDALSSPETPAATAEETAAASEEVSASTDEQLHAIQSVTDAAESLTNLSEELSIAVNRFKV